MCRDGRSWWWSHWRLCTTEMEEGWWQEPQTILMQVSSCGGLGCGFPAKSSFSGDGYHGVKTAPSVPGGPTRALETSTWYFLIFQVMTHRRWGSGLRTAFPKSVAGWGCCCHLVQRLAVGFQMLVFPPKRWADSCHLAGPPSLFL